MSSEPVISEEFKNRLGIEEESTFEVEKGHIMQFAKALGDDNPLWKDRKNVPKSRYDSMIAPPTFLQDQPLIEFVDKLLEIKCPLKRLLNGGLEVEWYKPMIPGDIITTKTWLADLYEKEGKNGKLLFMVCKTTFTNQRSELVARGQHTFIKL